MTDPDLLRQISFLHLPFFLILQHNLPGRKKEAYPDCYLLFHALKNQFQTLHSHAHKILQQISFTTALYLKWIFFVFLKNGSAILLYAFFLSVFTFKKSFFFFTILLLIISLRLLIISILKIFFS